MQGEKKPDEDTSEDMLRHIKVGGKEVDLTQRPKSSFLSDKWEELSTISKLFMLLIFIEVGVIIGLTIQRMVHPVHGMVSEKYSIIVLIDAIIFFIFAVDGVLNENVFQLIAFIFLTVSVAGVTIWQFFTSTDTEKWVLYVRLASVCVFAPLNVILSFFVYKSFGWFVYRKIGASIKMISMYRTYQQMLSLLKVDLVIGINLVIFAWEFLSKDLETYELVINIIAMVVTFAFSALGWAGIRQESKVTTIIYFLFTPVQPAYIIYKMVIFSVKPPGGTFYGPVLYSMGGLSIGFRIALIIWCVRCRVNFGNGLKRVFKREDEEEKPILSKVANRFVHNSE